jgi:NAD(P)H-hydrate epimerase
VLAGPGHNGNDGLLLAARMRARGWPVRCVLSRPADRRRPAPCPEIQAEAATAETWSGTLRIEGRWTIVDALLGSGSSGPARGVELEMLRAVSSLSLESGHFKLAVDLPSGLDADTGVAGEAAFEAEATLAIGAVKRGCLRDAARPWVGRIVAVPLPLPEPEGGEFFLLPGDAARWVRPLPADVHKYRRGEVSIWAGSPGMAGAAVLASRAALRAGAGLVRLWTHPEVSKELTASVPEVMTGVLEPGQPLPLALKRSGVLLAGPGAGRGPGAAAMLDQLIRETAGALVLDADALFLAAERPSILPAGGVRPWVATPHTGELARFFVHPPGERVDAVRELVARHPGSIWVAKGPNTLVGDAGGVTWNGTGNPGMATAGMGDVLAGMTAACLARGLRPADAARLAVSWHGLAADRAARRIPEATLTAGDVLAALPAAWRWLERRAAGGVLDSAPDFT